MIFIKEKNKLDTKIEKLSKVNIRKLNRLSQKLITVYLSTLINESIILEMLECAAELDIELEEVFLQC